jgi:hypothetical protein
VPAGRACPTTTTRTTAWICRKSAKALEQITGAIRSKDGKKKLDVLDFDACLMATVEVAYELKDTVDFLLASQETEPGDGMPYDDYLAWLTTYPEASPLSFSKAMVDTYVKSYAPKGSQSGGEVVGFSETKSAIHLGRMDDTARRSRTSRRRCSSARNCSAR